MRGQTAQLIDPAEGSESLRDGLLKPSAPLLQRIAAVRASAPHPDHVEVAQVPWALVLSSAIDVCLAAALEAAAPAARRVRRRFIDDVDADSLARSPAVLEVMHLSLLADATSPDGTVPGPERWSRIIRLMQPRVLDRLKETVGPAYIVIIDGVTERDPLDRGDLAAALEGLDDSQIVLCDGTHEHGAWLRSVRPGVLVLDARVAQLLAGARAAAPVAVPAILRAEDVALKVLDARGADKVTVVLRAEELRDIRRHLEVVSDVPGLPARASATSACGYFVRSCELHDFSPIMEVLYSTFASTEKRTRSCMMSLLDVSLSCVGPILCHEARSRTALSYWPVFQEAVARPVCIGWESASDKTGA